MKGSKEMLDQSNTETQQGRYQIRSSMSGSWKSNIMATTGLQQAWVALSLQPTAHGTLPLDQLHSVSAALVGRCAIGISNILRWLP